MQTSEHELTQTKMTTKPPGGITWEKVVYVVRWLTLRSLANDNNDDTSAVKF